MIRRLLPLLAAALLLGQPLTTSAADLSPCLMLPPIRLWPTPPKQGYP